MYPFLGGSDTRLIVVNITPTGLTIDGHAGYAKTGNDIICVAVSALAQNLVSSIEALTRDKILCQVKDGHMDIKWENLSEQGKLLVDSFFLGICGISNTYGENYVKATSRMCV